MAFFCLMLGLFQGNNSTPGWSCVFFSLALDGVGLFTFLMPSPHFLLPFDLIPCRYILRCHLLAFKSLAVIPYYYFFGLMYCQLECCFADALMSPLNMLILSMVTPVLYSNQACDLFPQNLWIYIQ